MLGRERIARGDALLHIGNNHDAAVRECRTGDFSARQIGELARELRLNAIEMSGIERDEHGQRVGVMLRLREQIRRDHRGGCRRVREDNQLRRAREHIDGNASRDELLRRGDIAISGANDNRYVTANRFPGPTITSQGRTGPAPKASAAIPWAPPAATTPSAPAMAAAASGIGPRLGLATQICLTPAACAVTAVIRTDEESG